MLNLLMRLLNQKLLSMLKWFSTDVASLLSVLWKQGNEVNVNEVAFEPEAVVNAEVVLSCCSLLAV